jgi:protease secretion system outer membrane protein
MRASGTWALAMCVLLAAPAARAQPAGGAFAAAFGAAQQNDAEYRAARFELQSREQNVPIARAGLLPNVGASYSRSRVRGERESMNALGQELTQDLDYRNPVASVQLRAPLLNLEAVHKFRSARSQVEGARSMFVGRGQELLDRLGSAYFQRLLTEHALALAQAQVDAYKAQAEAAQHRLGAGEGTRTEVAEALSSLAMAQAQLIEANDQRELAQRALARITGLETEPLLGLSEDFAPRPLPYARIEDWIDLAVEQNPNLQAGRALVKAARSDVWRARSGHLPRVDLIASAVDSRNESISTLNQQARQYSIGFQVNIPIFAGGGVDAGVSQAVAEASRAEAQLESDRRAVEVDIRRQFRATQTGQSKVDALREAVSASEVALEGARQGLAAGVRTNADVLDAVRRLFEARRDLVQARYELLLARLRLLALAGLPVQDVVHDIDQHLTERVVNLPGAVRTARGANS